MKNQATSLTFEQIAFLAEQQKGASADNLLKMIRAGMPHSVPFMIQCTDQEEQYLELENHIQTPKPSQIIQLSENKELLYFRMRNPNPADKSSSATVNIYDIGSKRTLSMAVKRNHIRGVEVKEMDDKTYQTCLRYTS